MKKIYLILLALLITLISSFIVFGGVLLLSGAPGDLEDINGFSDYLDMVIIVLVDSALLYLTIIIWMKVFVIALTKKIKYIVFGVSIFIVTLMHLAALQIGGFG